MAKFIDLTGRKFGEWTIIRRVFRVKKRTHWLCECKCGFHYFVDASQLLKGLSTKCKTCHNKEAVKKRPKKHGNCEKGNSAEYRTWTAMRTRCLNPGSDQWKNYGGRGIILNESWNDFSNFLDDMGKRPKGTSLERINVNGAYCKENCMWASPLQQSNNKRTNILLEKDGVIQTKTAWAKVYKMPYTSFSRAIKKYGWPLPEPPKDDEG